jgi:hypothetical protein
VNYLVAEGAVDRRCIAVFSASGFHDNRRRIGNGLTSLFLLWKEAARCNWLAAIEEWDNDLRDQSGVRHDANMRRTWQDGEASARCFGHETLHSDLRVATAPKFEQLDGMFQFDPVCVSNDGSPVRPWPRSSSAITGRLAMKGRISGAIASDDI